MNLPKYFSKESTKGRKKAIQIVAHKFGYQRNTVQKIITFNPTYILSQLKLVAAATQVKNLMINYLFRIYCVFRGQPIFH
jgi:hypothetical protein